MAHCALFCLLIIMLLPLQVQVRVGFRAHRTADDVIIGRRRSYINTKYCNIISVYLSYDDASKTAPRAPI